MTRNHVIRVKQFYQQLTSTILHTLFKYLLKPVGPHCQML